MRSDAESVTAPTTTATMPTNAIRLPRLHESREEYRVLEIDHGPKTRKALTAIYDDGAKIDRATKASAEEHSERI